MVVVCSPTNRRPRMASIAASLDHIKRNPLGALERQTIERICREHGHEWRHRQLDPATTVALFVQQVAHGNLSCCEIRHLAGNGSSFTPQAYCDARARVPLGVYNDLMAEVCAATMPQARRPEHLWRGHRTFHIDGSGFSMPDTPFRPTQKPRWMSQEDFDALPESIVVRELRRTVCRPGLGHVTLTLVTTLLDARKYPAADLLE